MDFKKLLREKNKEDTQNSVANVKIDYSSKKINLLPLNYYRQKRKRFLFFVIAIMFCVSSVYFFYYLYQVKIYTGEYEKEIYSIESLDGYSGLNEQIDRLSEEKNSQNMIFDLKKRIDSKSKLLIAIERNNKSILYTLSTMESELPEGVSFESLQVDSETQININGFATNTKDIAILIHNLKETNYFKKVFVNNINYSEEINIDNVIEIKYSFSIACEFGGDGNETK